jgi:hypothetical protein
MSIVAATCLELFSLMSDSKTISSLSRVTLKIFLEVFLHIEEMFKDCTFWDRMEMDGKRKTLFAN